ncbi:MAG: outer membrane beta-barrel protein [Cyclobacteriaceae bacterium]|nr:outer membrane beta-barrel protein [Cyclobacteriaceae bacterium]
MKKVLILMAALSVAQIVNAQNLSASGTLVDASDASTIVGATVLFVNVKDSTLSKFGTSNENGQFIVQKLEKAFYRINITSMGYLPYTRVFRMTETDVNLGTISLQPDVKMLQEVEVKGEVIAMEIKGDTLQYNADAFKVNPDASTKDLISKMPGIEVDASGVKANGEQIQQVLLDGKRFFGQDPLLSLNTIPAEVVDKVEVFDQRSEQSQFTGFDDGNTTKTMNVVTKTNKRNGQFGKIYAGAGTQGLYTAGGNFNSYKGDKRITLIGMSNNNNQQNFSNEDLAGTGGGGGGPRGRSSNPLMTANQSGITSTNSVGANYTDKWGKAITVESSYFFNQTQNNNNRYTNRESFLSSETQYYEETKESSTDNLNHRFNARVTYDINDNNKLIIRPRLSFQDNFNQNYTLGTTTNSLSEILNQTENNLNNNNLGLNLNNEITFQHKFDKLGRSISVEVNTLIDNTNLKNKYQDLTLDSLSDFKTDQIRNSMGTAVTFTEPVGRTGQISTAYELSYGKRASEKNTYIVDPLTDGQRFEPILSNHFTSGQTTHEPSVTYSNRSFGRFFNIGLAYQHVSLDNKQSFPVADNFNNSFNSILPTVMGRIELGPGTNAFFRYAARTNTPSVSQLQNVIDNTNPLFWSTGNPDLDQNYRHDLFIRIGKNNVEKNRSLSNFIRVQYSNNQIVNSTQVMAQDSTFATGLILPRGGQLSQPVNMEGYFNIGDNLTYSFNVEKLKSKINTSVGASFQNNPGLTNEENNFARTYGINGRLSFISNISEKVDFSIAYIPGYNSVINTIQRNRDSKYISQTISGNVNLIFGKGFVFRSTIDYQNYNGVSDAFNIEYTLWNMALAKKFLKNDAGELELSVFDLLKQNQAISQTVSTNYLEETVTQVLQQYFLLKFTYNFRKFK